MFAEVRDGQPRANGGRDMGRWYAWGLLTFVLGACGTKAPARLDNAPPPPREAAVKPLQTAVPVATASASSEAPTTPAPTASTSMPPDLSLSGPPFPPPAFVPPHSRSAAPGDGVFTLLDEGAAAGTGALARTTVHPLQYKKDPMVVIVAMDLRRVELVPVAGTEEPVSKTVPLEKRPGLVPATDQQSLIAVFNGGFLSKHGEWGMRVAGDDFGTPREDGCTVAFLDDGSLRIATHRALAPVASRLRSFRQTPPCLVEGGTSDPRLAHEDTARLWGAAMGGKREIRRTALGLDATGRTLFFWHRRMDMGARLGARDEGGRRG